MADYVCAISGLAAPANEDLDDENEDDAPIGWAEVTVKIRKVHPRWPAIAAARTSIVETYLAQAPKEKRGEVLELAEVLADAQLAALKATVGQFLIEEHQVYVSTEELPGLMETLGIKAAGTE